MITYFELGPHKRLNEIVVAGSHDAGITNGADNVRTQTKSILGQAASGSRVFDLRITAAGTGQINDWGVKTVQLRSFHADGLVKMGDNDKYRYVEDLDMQVPLRRTKLAKASIGGVEGGGFGMGLTTMLKDAKSFVESKKGRTEFLILKFDKCDNWSLIAFACQSLLGSALYSRGGNLNTKTLADLAGKVIVLFSSAGLDQLKTSTWDFTQILAFKNLYHDGKVMGYDPSLAGLQYYGKGGTSVWNPVDKESQNVKKHAKLWSKAAGVLDDAAVRMMYWTTTGIVANIGKRDDNSWDPPSMERLKAVWADGMGDYVDDLVPLNFGSQGVALGQQRKKYMPNIIMIDFVDEFKGQYIRNLNEATDFELGEIGTKSTKMKGVKYS
jgi:hypothetical protein